MTDEAAATAATAVTGADASATATANGSAAVTASDPFAGLQNAESLEWIKSKGFKALDPVVESARYADKVKSEFEDFKGKALTLPLPDAKQEEWDAYYAKIGRPEKPEGYEFKLPEGLPENLPYDAERATAYKTVSHLAGLTPKQAQVVHDWAAKDAAGQFLAMKQAETKQVEAADVEIVKDWGPHDSDGYKTNLQHADRAINKLGIMDELKAGGYLTSEGNVKMPKLAKALALVGRQLYAEDTLVTGNRASEPRDAAKTLYPVDPFYPNGR